MKSGWCCRSRLRIFLFRFAFVFFCDRDREIRDAIEIGDGLVVGMVGNDDGNLAAQVLHSCGDRAGRPGNDRTSKPGSPSSDGNSDAARRHCISKFRGDRREVLAEIRPSKISKLGGIELDAHQEEIGIFVAMLIGVQDVAVVAKNKVGNAWRRHLSGQGR